MHFFSKLKNRVLLDRSKKELFWKDIKWLMLWLFCKRYHSKNLSKYWLFVFLKIWKNYRLCHKLIVSSCSNRAFLFLFILLMNSVLLKRISTSWTRVDSLSRDYWVLFVLELLRSHQTTVNWTRTYIFL